MQIQGKDRLFHAELEYVMSCTKENLIAEYPDLVDILNRAASKNASIPRKEA